MTNTAVKYRQLLSEARFTGAADTVQRGAVDLILRCVVQENINFVHVNVYIFSKINQALNPTTAPSTPPPPTRPQKWSARQIVDLPTSHISFVTQHVLHVPVTGNFKSDACSLHKEF